uniref:Uncharacterized protein n=1 Tax=Oryza brachyantha TaxID=4533 RepID=J3L371_ORYBR
PRQRRLRLAAVAQRLLRPPRGRQRPLQEHPPAVRLHQPPHLRRHLFRPHGALPDVVPFHRHGQPHLLLQEHPVHPLLRVQRPRQHRHAGHDRLQHGVPPAVRHEAAHRRVRQHVALRRPRLDDEAPALGPLQEALGEERLQIGLRRLVELLRRVVARRAPHHPQEPLPARLQPRRHLLDLLRAEPADAAEAEEHHAAVGLRVQPRQALLAAVLAHLLRLYQRPDAVDGRRRDAGKRAAPRGHGLDGARLERAERVDEETLGAVEVGRRFHEFPVGRVVTVHEWQDGVRRRKRGDAGDPHELFAHLPEAHRGLSVQDREVQEESDDLRAGRAEHEGGDTKLVGDVEGRVAEEVDHEHGRGGACEEVAEAGVREAGDLEGERLMVHGRHGRHLHLGQTVERYGRVGRGDAGEERPRRAGVAVRRVDDDDGDGEAAGGEDLPELDHRDQVAHARRRVEHHWLPSARDGRSAVHREEEHGDTSRCARWRSGRGRRRRRTEHVNRGAAHDERLLRH